jgi:hypothetical protein
MTVVTVSTSEYQGVHGRKPRGTGTWVFWLGYARTRSWTSPVYTRYSDAVRGAKAAARKFGLNHVEVGA